MSKEYEIVIGLEVHVELATKTKIFCGCTTEFGGEPNTHCCPVCSGMPGTLPTLNKKVVEFAAAVGLALGCDITRKCKFDRKNYFYPDLPKAYQISQLYLPICRNGGVTIETKDGGEKFIRLHEIHMEEDAGKLIHDEWTGQSLIDFNRCGVPLIEIVSEPDMRSADEVISYLTNLKSTIEYLGVSDCKMQEGSMRADVNLSVREAGAEEFGTRTEMKNLNSFKAIARAIEAEAARQIDLIEDGGTVRQETRRWDDAKGASYAMRSKEDAQDYRYFPEPDLPPIEISEEFLAEIKSREPEMRAEKKARYIDDYALPEYDADILTGTKALADMFEGAVALGCKPKEVSNWLMVDTLRLMKEDGVDASDLKFTAEQLAALIGLLDAGKINRPTSREVFEAMFREAVDPAAYVEEMGLIMEQDDDALRAVIEQVIADNPKSVADYKGGKKKAIGALVGQTMKAMKGKADPGTVNRMLAELLDE